MLGVRPDVLDSPIAHALPVFRPRRSPVTFGIGWATVLVCADLAVLLAAVAVSLNIPQGGLGALFDRRDLTITDFALVLIWLFVFRRSGLYRRSFSSSARDEIYSSAAALCMTVVPVLALFTVYRPLAIYRVPVLTLTMIAVVGIGALRAILYSMRSRIAVQSARNVAIVGSRARVDAVASELHLTMRDALLRLSIDDFDEMLERTDPADPESIEWVRRAIDWGCDTLLVTEAIPPELMPAILRLTEARGIKFAFAPTRIRAHAYDFTIQKDGGLALICPRSLTICTPSVQMVRRLFDLLIVVPVLIVCAPLLAALALAVVVDSGRPIFYKQRRVGMLGKEFDIYKFRSMPVDAESNTGPVWSPQTDRRATRVGAFLRRTSLDELPQLFNVLRGDMSLVGPRPERPMFVESFRKTLPRYDERLLVRPGITGWSHINMQRNVDPSAMHERLGYDLFYLEHWSMFMDLSIIVKTAAEFLFQRAA